MTGLETIDALAVLAICAKAAGYAAALTAMGGALFAAVFARAADPDTLRLARRMAAVAAAIGLAVLALRFGIRAARISGMGVAGATDPMMLGFVWQSPLGAAAIWRGLGEIGVLTILLPGLAGRLVPLAGAFAIAVSYTLVGHTLGDPRWVMAGLLAIHLLAVAFWVGALLPLFRAAGTGQGVTLLHKFGTFAAWAVGALAAAGSILAWLLAGSLVALLGTAYGVGLLLKLAVVCGLLLLAAGNKWRLVPALAAGRPGASAALRRSIALEGGAVILILLVTAAITTVTTPPVNL
ncbi:copper resistance D family protein [Palleronia pelagia]|uniref:Putative copper resistance protein D n=1 Tax=Palleronia pelagia TaxID=387096 RepID=A0A1H8FJR3_9RHOB|nr:CopD family protein [Palleronia pelagia]SEN31845.1 putative copper resistance protein D [Palleronia pelagia]